MINIRVEYVLILTIVIFVLYNLYRCSYTSRVANGFSIGGNDDFIHISDTLILNNCSLPSPSPEPPEPPPPPPPTPTPTPSLTPSPIPSCRYGHTPLCTAFSWAGEDTCESYWTTNIISKPGNPAGSNKHSFCSYDFFGVCDRFGETCTPGDPSTECCID